MTREDPMKGWPCKLLRGGVELGTVTHDLHEDAGPCEVGHNEPPLADQELRMLLLREWELSQRLAEAPSDSAQAELIQAEMDSVQAEGLRPSIVMVRLDNGETYQVVELHLDGGKVFWR